MPLRTVSGLSVEPLVDEDPTPTPPGVEAAARWAWIASRCWIMLYWAKSHVRSSLNGSNVATELWTYGPEMSVLVRFGLKFHEISLKF